MIALSHDEAVLFRVLTGFFGKEQVVPHMSAMSVCGGTLPDGLKWPQDENNRRNGRAGLGPLNSQDPAPPQDPVIWAKANKCLFTIVDRNDLPRMVIEFASDFSKTIDVVALEHQRYMRPLLSAAGVRYVTITSQEFSDILDPQSSLDLVALLQAKVEPSESAVS